jgi:hypothetical protein
MIEIAIVSLSESYVPIRTLQTSAFFAPSALGLMFRCILVAAVLRCELRGFVVKRKLAFSKRKYLTPACIENFPRVMLPTYQWL